MPRQRLRRRRSRPPPFRWWRGLRVPRRRGPADSRSPGRRRTRSEIEMIAVLLLMTCLSFSHRPFSRGGRCSGQPVRRVGRAGPRFAVDARAPDGGLRRLSFDMGFGRRPSRAGKSERALARRSDAEARAPIGPSGARWPFYASAHPGAAVAACVGVREVGTRVGRWPVRGGGDDADTVPGAQRARAVILRGVTRRAAGIVAAPAPEDLAGLPIPVRARGRARAERGPVGREEGPEVLALRRVDRAEPESPGPCTCSPRRRRSGEAPSSA